MNEMTRWGAVQPVLHESFCLFFRACSIAILVWPITRTR